MLAEAKRECDRILGEAREQAVREASQTEIVKLAERQAGEIVDDARRQARETRLEMEDWADSILSTLEVNLDKFLPRSSGAASGCTSARRRRSSPGSPWASPRARTTTSPIRRHGHAAGGREQARLAQLRRPRGSGRRPAADPRRGPRERQRREQAAVAVRRRRERRREGARRRDGLRRRQHPHCAFAVAIATEGGRYPVDFGRRIQNMFLTAWNEGVVSCPNGMADRGCSTRARPRRRPAPAEHPELRLPEAPAGPESKTADEWSAEANRKPLDELVRRI